MWQLEQHWSRGWLLGVDMGNKEIAPVGAAGGVAGGRRGAATLGGSLREALRAASVEGVVVVWRQHVEVQHHGGVHLC